jgi:hypothetical protein
LKRVAFLVLFWGLFCQQIAGQEGRLLSVIRPAGAVMFSQPTAKSPRLTTLAYADKVLLVRDFASGITQYDGSHGYWIQVRFNQYDGFVFRNDVSLMIETRETKGDYALIIPQGGSLAEVSYSPNLQYYAVIDERPTQKIEKVDIDFRLSVDPEGKEHLTISSTASATPLFLFGSSRKQRTKWFDFYNLSEGQRQLFGKNDSVPKTIRLIDNRVSLYTELKWAPKTDKELSYAELMVKEEIEHKRTQKLFPLAEYRPIDQYNYPIYLLWCGDLDGDKQADFLIAFGDLLKHYDLYLSGSAVKHHILEKVATWNAALRL